MRIALIDALKHSIEPVEDAFRRLWPDARTTNLMDDSLSADLAEQGTLDAAMTDRFLTLARYQQACAADAILFTCSAFGPCIEACAADLSPMPVLKPNEAAIEEAVALAGPRGAMGLLSTFPRRCGPCRRSSPPSRRRSRWYRVWRTVGWPRWTRAMQPNMTGWRQRRRSGCGIATSSY
jgi:hypothetical protein